MAENAFPLRLRDPRLRELVREVARHEGVSQNELIEQAIEDEMLVRGRLLDADLQAAARRLNQLSEEAYREMVGRSARQFAEGEARPDPLEAHPLHGDTASTSRVPQQAAGAEQRGVLGAFHTGRA
jgi:hypothetical protein